MPGTFTLRVGPGQPQLLPPGTTTTITTGVVGMMAEASPDLPPGRNLSVSDKGEVSITSSIDAPIVTIDRPWVIEVMDSPIATAFNRTQGRTYVRQWYQCMKDASHGDLIEISPGAINATLAESQGNYYDTSLAASGMPVFRGVTIRNIPGRGRWRLFPVGTVLPYNKNGIVVFAPNDSADILGKKTFSIEGFDLTDQFGTSASGVVVRSKKVGDTWDGLHSSVTFRNFKVGKNSGTSAQGFSGAAEVLVFEDGHVFDCGSGSGQDHNLYVSARTMTLRGIRTARTRGWIGTPWATGSARTLEGHMAKLSAVTGTIEGCCFDGSPDSDHSLMLQMKAGGNWIVRGNLFIDSRYPNVANGAINMCREWNATGTAPNFEWWAGLEGNSLLFEKNVFVGHYPRPVVWFFAQGHVQALKPANDLTAPDAEKLRSLIVRDNIGMVTSASVQWRLAGFPGAPAEERPMWIHRDPNAGATWTARGNTVMEHQADERGFDGRELKVYIRSDGPLPATAGTVNTYRFQWPHGCILRTDAHRGLG